MYNPGQTAPAASARAAMFVPVGRLGFDQAGNLYATVAGDSVTVYTGDLAHSLPDLNNRAGTLLAKGPSSYVWLGPPDALPNPPILPPAGYVFSTDAASDADGDAFIYYRSGEVHNNVAVGNDFGAILEYAAGTHKILRTIPIAHEASMAAGPDGTVYVAEYQAGPDSHVLVFAPGADRPTARLTDQFGFHGVVSLQTDRSGRLYVLSGMFDGPKLLSIYAGRSLVLERQIHLDISPMYMFIAPSGALAITGEPETIEVLAPGTYTVQMRIHTPDCLGGFDRWGRLFTFACNGL